MFDGNGSWSMRRLNRFDRQLDELARGRSATPSDRVLDPALAETARRLHALRDDAAPAPSVLAAIWEDLMGHADTAPHTIAAPLSHLPVNGRVRSPSQHGTLPPFDPTRRRRPLLELATVAVLVLVLVSGYGAYRLAPSRPQGGVPHFAGGQGSTAAAEPDVPKPSECRVAPLPMDRLIATGEPSVPSLLVSRRQEIGGGGVIDVSRNDLPVGVRADPATVAGVTGTVRERIACLNAGASAPFNALFTDDYYRRELEVSGRPRVFGVGAEQTYLTPGTVPREDWSVMPDVRDVQTLADGRVGALVVAPTPGQVSYLAYFVFARQGDRWLIDEQGVIIDALETVILAQEFAFEPAALTVPAGTPVTITLRNTSGGPRSFVIDEITLRLEVAPGQEGSVTIEAPAGVYAFYNDLPNKQDRSMAGTLVVEDWDDPTSGTPTATTPTVDLSTAVTIEADDLIFDPATVAIPAHTEVSVTLTNAGMVMHNFSVDALGLDVDVLAGEAKTLVVNAAAGDYAFYCNMPGHRDAGMTGTIRVVARGTPEISRAATPTSERKRGSEPGHASTALLLIVDTSGSMNYDPSDGVGAKIDLAKDALRLAARSVAYGDHVGVLAFNDRQRWVLPITAIATDADRVRIDEAIATMTAEGGTEIYPALALGFDAIRTVDADRRHVVLLSDGKSRTGSREEYQTLVAGMTAAGVTLSTVAIGGDADAELLRFLAEQGAGRYHVAETATDIAPMTLLAVRADGTPGP